MSHRASVPDRIVADVVGGIHAGDLVPGQRLVEADLIDRLSISRGPLREALKRLAAMGLVELAPHRGARIRQMSRRETLEKLDILEVLLGLAARLAATRIQIGSNRRRFRTAAVRFMKHRERGGWVEVVTERDRFYRTLLDVAGNRGLAEQVELSRMHLMRNLIRDMDRAHRRRQFDYHEKIIAFVLDGDSARAESTMRRRVRAMVPIYESLPEERFASETRTPPG